MKTVALVGDAVPTPNVSTGWSPGAVINTPGTNLTVNNKLVLLASTCTFTQASTGITSVVSLSANPTFLRDGGSSLLLNGDKAQDTLGNSLAIVATQAILLTG